MKEKSQPYHRLKLCRCGLGGELSCVPGRQDEDLAVGNVVFDTVSEVHGVQVTSAVVSGASTPSHR
eukprot:10592668-Heterocapsa_arctica.AAC.1